MLTKRSCLFFCSLLNTIWSDASYRWKEGGSCSYVVSKITFIHLEKYLYVFFFPKMFPKPAAVYNSLYLCWGIPTCQWIFTGVLCSYVELWTYHWSVENLTTFSYLFSTTFTAQTNALYYFMRESTTWNKAIKALQGDQQNFWKKLLFRSFL